MFEWQKSFLGKLGLPADLNDIIGRQVRCRFPATYTNEREQAPKHLEYTIQGIGFANDRDCITGNPISMQLLVEPSDKPANICGNHSIMRPYLYYNGTSWRFYEINKREPPDPDGLRFHWKYCLMTTVTLI